MAIVLLIAAIALVLVVTALLCAPSLAEIRNQTRVADEPTEPPAPVREAPTYPPLTLRPDWRALSHKTDRTGGF